MINVEEVKGVLALFSIQWSPNDPRERFLSRTCNIVIRTMLEKVTKIVMGMRWDARESMS